MRLLILLKALPATINDFCYPFYEYFDINYSCYFASIYPKSALLARMSGHQQHAPANLSGPILLAQQRSREMQDLHAGHASQLHHLRAELERLRSELASLPSGSPQLQHTITGLSNHIGQVVRQIARLADITSELNLEGPAPLPSLQARLSHETEVLRLTQNYLNGQRSRMSAAGIADFQGIINEHQRQINYWRERIRNEHPGAAS